MKRVLSWFVSKFPFRIYRLKGVGLYYIRPLTFGENMRVTDIMRKKLGTTTADRVSVAEICDMLYEGGGVRDLLFIIMKPFFPSQIPAAELLDDLSERKVARILHGFFALNPGWIQRLTVLAYWVKLPEKTQTNLMRKIAPRSTRSSVSPAGTLHTQN